MIYLVVSHHHEARPLISYFQLKKDHSSHYFEIYEKEDVALIISGIGKLNTAVAATHIVSRSQDSRKPLAPNTALINVGICGSENRDFPLGQMALVNQIMDHDSGRRFYPDILISHTLQEAGIETFSHGVRAEEADQISLELVDMEASGFYEAASRFLGPHQIHILKVISDYLGEPSITGEYVQQLMERNTAVLAEYLDKVRQMHLQTQDIISSREYQLLEDITQNLHLTQTQRHDLIKWARQYKLRNKKDLGFLQGYTQIYSRSKQERKQQIERIRKVLDE